MSAVEIPDIFAGLFEPHRYKVFYGGRGSGKSWAAARALVHLAHHKPLRVVCAREFQNSIEESVPGNYTKDTEGCLLVGMGLMVSQKVSMVTDSQMAINLMRKEIGANTFTITIVDQLKSS